MDYPTGITIELHGRDAGKALPSLFQPATRSAGPTGDPTSGFLPDGYLTAASSYEVGAAARGSANGAGDKAQGADPDEIVVLELDDGSTFIGNAARLRASLAQTHPELLGPNGEILLETLRTEASVPRGFITDAVGHLVRKVFTLKVDTAGDPITEKARELLAKEGVVDLALLGVSWLGTKALMAAIESRLDAPAGALYRWADLGGKTAPQPVRSAELPQPDADGKARPILVFIHGTGSSSLGGFGDLRTGDRDLWGTLERCFGEHIYAFEHRTLSESPIDNALALAAALPAGSHVSLVSHSRGGLVADLLCLGDFGSRIEDYHYPFEGLGEADIDAQAERLADLRAAHAAQRAQLHQLNQLLLARKLVVQRYVRVASPANGTRLASANFDLFLSGLLTLIGQVPFFFGSPYYAAFKRVVVDIARNRTNPHMVPGIEAMLPDSPMARLLRDAPVRPGIQMAVIAGDIEGGNLLKRLGVLLTDYVFFDNTDNDLVVDTMAMLSGVAPRAQAKVLFDRGADVSHFRYFGNMDTRTALRDWLVVERPERIDAFRPLPSAAEYAEAMAQALQRDATAMDRPIVVVLPGVMGSHLKRGADDRVWFDPLDIASGGLQKLAFGLPGIEADELFAMFYGKLCADLAKSHRVECFAYDWRQPLDVLAERFGAMLDGLLRQTQQPIRLLAHSMGGLVVRATIHKRRAVMDALMARDGARLLMLGTPHQGAHSMVENLVGKGDTLRSLVRLDLSHSMQEVLDIVAGFRGALQLLPKPGFKDIFQGDEGGGEFHDYQDSATWQAFKGSVKDFWFGDGRVGAPSQAVLDEASWLWRADRDAFQDGKPSLPAAYAAKSIYVFGAAANTPCGVRVDKGQLKMVGTTRGDGTVSWESGRIGGIGSFYYMPAEHGDLTATKEHFPALTELLASGTTAGLPTSPPQVRAIEQPAPVRYDAGPPMVDDADALQRGLMGGSQRSRVAPRAKRRLEVCVRAGDLRFITHQPIMVGHYEHDPMAGPEALIDAEMLGGDLTQRFNLGLYTGPLGTATSVLRRPNAFESRRGSLAGAIVTGLGPYDGALSQRALTEAVRTGVMRYLLQTSDVLGKEPRELRLASLLLGYNSNANMTPASSVEALVRGVVEGNAKFHETTRLDIRVTRLDIVEIYLDTAITAVYALRQLAPRLHTAAEQLGTALVLHTELDKGDGYRQRLFDNQNNQYWPRLIITDAERNEDGTPRDGASARTDGPRTMLAERLRFMYLGQRARAEAVLLQRQPELIEKLVRDQIATPVWQEDFGRMLFQLMVPPDFKEAARALERVVLVVDAGTANLPWELMLADAPQRGPQCADDDRLPLALRTAVVRQFATTKFRRQLRESAGRNALVVGNPSVHGFTKAFPGTPDRPMAEPPKLGGAEAEALAVVAAFKGLGYDVVPEVGEDRNAKDVLAALYRRPYRFVHISAHGVFDLLHADGKRRSGVVLSDGLLITAAEIAAMEMVPELVFLNCCHLGKIEGRADDPRAQVAVGADGNKLAASVARELIDIGVRCVVVAGWAVSDLQAQRFGQGFYEHLLLRRETFGQAVFEARRLVWADDAKDITWGAFQAYGEPGWRAEPRADNAGGPGSDGTYSSPEEVLDGLARIRSELRRRPGQQDERELRARAKQVEQMLEQRCPAGWAGLPQLLSALGATWYDLQRFKQARTAYLAAVQAEDLDGRVPIRDIQTLANAEVRLGEKLGTLIQDDPQSGGTASGEALIRIAMKRLDGLDALIAARGDDLPAALHPVNTERSALRASAYKRLAGLYARRILAAGDAPAAQRAAWREAMVAALTATAAAYRAGDRDPDGARPSPYHALNRLAVQVLWPGIDAAGRAGALALASQCAEAVAQERSRGQDPWADVMQVEAELVASMLDGRLARTDDEGRAALEQLQRSYDDCLANVVVTPVQLDSMASQMELLSRCADALQMTGDPRGTDLVTLAGRLLELVRHLQPHGPARQDRPSAALAGTPAKRPAAAAQRTPPAPRAAAKKRAAVKKAPAKTPAPRKAAAKRK
ncbi:CHAT domain-containing protein [Pseudorhodoferax sp. Leaf267]|uniref:CHAT domain-containing protein n=1 Tax=Pseudorhodoferax sp. Leaf267 TaxID=1736316 RepID=UPI0006F4A752|nr:CHAT domain-containing protein [Pseudorhodoferax sp. Leaf267]KQP23040.1 hypothetical protein ASF43_03910 [Pseudorhodoferax sp. Leaf267]